MGRTALLALGLAIAANGFAATSMATKLLSRHCGQPEFRQLDFWVGEWDVRWDASGEQAAGRGTNIVTRELDNCVIQERFTGDASTQGLVGHSVSTYHKAPKLWRQTWVDNQGGYFALTGGLVENKFILENTRLRDGAPYLRMVFEDIKPDSLTWRWQRSRDAGKTWEDSWVIYYARKR